MSILVLRFERFGDLYTEENVAISGIHTHAGPGGYLQYFLYSISTLGFIQESFDVIVNAIVQSIVQAHHNLKPGSIFINQGNQPTKSACNLVENLLNYLDQITLLMKFYRGCGKRRNKQESNRLSAKPGRGESTVSGQRWYHDDSFEVCGWCQPEEHWSIQLVCHSWNLHEQRQQAHQWRQQRRSCAVLWGPVCYNSHQSTLQLV